MSFKTAKRYRGGRKREKPQAFPVGEKKKLPRKPKYPAKRKASEKDFATVDRFVNIIAPVAEAWGNPEIQKARSAWSRVRVGIGSMKDFHLLDDFVDVLTPEYMAKDPGIRKAGVLGAESCYLRSEGEPKFTKQELSNCLLTAKAFTKGNTGISIFAFWLHRKEAR